MLKYVYGEDGLTLWYLTRKINDFLHRNEDSSEPSDSILYYRPSFGRGGCYGEFDSILVTIKRIYLIESKWIKSARKITLSKEQQKRHEIFRWYFHNLPDPVSGTEISDELWDRFRRDNNETQFFNRFRKTIPTSRSLLSKNIRRIIKDLRDGREREWRNVALLFISNEAQIENVNFETPQFVHFKLGFEETRTGWASL